MAYTVGGQCTSGGFDHIEKLARLLDPHSPLSDMGVGVQLSVCAVWFPKTV